MGIGILITSAILYVAALFLTNRFRSAPEQEAAAVHRREGPNLPTVPADATLRVIAWNIGYAGMGAESDFVADGGRQSRPLSRDLVVANLASIVSELRDEKADITMIEEAAKPSWFTYQVDVLHGLVETMEGCDWTYGDDLATRLLPPPWKTTIGNAVFSRYRIESASRHALPLEPTFVAGTFRKIYRMHVVRLPVSGSDRSVVFVSIHLAAFDKDAEIRLKQARKVIEFAVAEHARGNAVVVGGDFNLRLSNAEFPHQTAQRDLFWIHDWPADLTPAGWTLAADMEHPTNRTAQKPFIAGDNYTSVIDGFLCSPNVVVHSVHTIDLGFRHSDHQPVILNMSLLALNGGADLSPGK